MRPRRSSRKQPRVVTGDGLIGEVAAVYNGSDGEATTALYRRLDGFGVLGKVAVNVFRAQKTSERAKAYRGGQGGKSYRQMAYDRKAWSIENLCRVLGEHAGGLGITWGWAIDSRREAHEHILYVDLPTGQISWHNGERYAGPDYAKPWDGIPGQAAQRICAWIAQVLEGADAQNAKQANHP